MVVDLNVEKMKYISTDLTLHGEMSVCMAFFDRNNSDGYAG